MRYYEDLTEGETHESGTRSVTERELVDFARQYDPQYFHSDPEAARGSSFGGIIASGIFTMAIWRQLDHQVAHDIAWICGVAWDDVRFPVAVRPGDTLKARARCLSKRPSAKDPRRGVVTYQYVLENQRGETVFSCRSTNLIERRGAGA
ncbi:MAG: MaoC family dehydratase [Proteobacteria bacterium]|nr:MaoC family dehydratase [Pseudomonadota bacterium]